MFTITAQIVSVTPAAASRRQAVRGNAFTAENAAPADSYFDDAVPAQVDCAPSVRARSVPNVIRVICRFCACSSFALEAWPFPVQSVPENCQAMFGFTARISCWDRAHRALTKQMVPAFCAVLSREAGRERRGRQDEVHPP